MTTTRTRDPLVGRYAFWWSTSTVGHGHRGGIIRRVRRSVRTGQVLDLTVETPGPASFRATTLSARCHGPRRRLCTEAELASVEVVMRRGMPKVPLGSLRLRPEPEAAS